MQSGPNQCSPGEQAAAPSWPTYWMLAEFRLLAEGWDDLESPAKSAQPFGNNLQPSLSSKGAKDGYAAAACQLALPGSMVCVSMMAASWGSTQWGAPRAATPSAQVLRGHAAGVPTLGQGSPKVAGLLCRAQAREGKGMRPWLAHPPLPEQEQSPDPESWPCCDTR